MKPKLPFYVALLFLLMRACPAMPQEIFFNKVLPPEGKIFLHVSGMVQDAEGYMWFATKKGLFRYDGYQMINYKNNPSDTNTLASDALEAICVNKAGKLWIATLGNGLEQFDPVTGTFKHFRHDPNDQASLSADWLSALLVDKEGVLWVGAGNGLDRFDAQTGKFIHFRNQPNDPTSLSNNAVVAIYEDLQGTLWIGTGSVYTGKDDEGGLNRLDKKTGKFTRYLHDPKNPYSLINNKVRAIFEDSKGNFWVGTSGDGLHTMDRRSGKFQRHLYDPAHPEKLSRPPFKKKPYLDHITFITEDITGAIWIGTTGAGLNYYDPKKSRSTQFELEKDTAGSFTDREVWCAYTSRDGVLWISTINGNLYRVNPQRRDIAYHQSEEGCFFSFFEEADGTLWAATQKGLLVKTRQGESDIRRYVHDPADPASLSNDFVRALKQDRDGNMWVGTDEGLNLWDKNKGNFTRYRYDPKNPNSLSNDFILAVYEDRKSDLWIGTIKGLNRMNRKTGSVQRYIFHPADTGTLYLNVVSSVLEDRQGHMWAGCAMIGDVHLLNPENGKFSTFLKGKGIQTLCEDAAGTFWAGGDEGLFQYNTTTDTFVPFIDSSTHTEFSFVRSIVEDDEKNLWIGAENGILKLNPQRLVTRIYGKSYGVNGNILCHRSGYKGTKGKLFFGNYSGYFVFLPEQLPKSPVPPQIVITDFHLANKLVQQGKNDPLSEPVSKLKSIRLQHNQNAFSFDFAAIDFSSPEDNRHFFMLQNYDDGWNQAGSERRAVYYNVPPGKYIFRVKAANSNGIWAEKSIDIVIIPPWWSTWWFRAAAVLCVAALFYGLIRWRLHQKFRLMLERSEKEKQVAELQQQKTELEMQALRAQMNPHFIFNSLNSINRFILQNNRAQASEYLTKFSKLVRLILQNSQASLISLESELEALELYLDLEALRFEHHFAYKISVSKDIDIEVLKVPPLIIQPYAENAIWHGLMHKEEKGHLEIEISQEEEVLCCKITDDGIGRKKAAELKSKSSTSHKSMGMRITADRIAILQQEKELDTYITINDLVLADGSAGGTEVIIKIPVVE